MVELTFEMWIVIFIFIMILAGYAMIIEMHKQTIERVPIIDIRSI